MTRGSRWRRALGVLGAIAACGGRGGGASAEGEAGGAEAARGPFAELPFPTLGDADYEVDPEVGIELARSHVLVTIAEGAGAAEVEAAVAATKGEIVGALGPAGVILVRLPGEVVGAARHAAVEALRAHPAVRAASLDLRVGPTLLPPEARGTSGWDWSRQSGARRFWSLAAMGMPVAWNLKPILDEDDASVRKVTVAISDVALQAHPDLVPERIFGGGGGTTPYVPSDVFSYHATSVAGVIGARWDGRFADGISPNVRMIVGDAHTGRSADGAAGAKSLAETVAAAWRATQSEFAPRLLNLSLGMNYYRVCYAVKGRSRRCDPRIGADPADAARWGAPVPDADCKGQVVRAVLAAHAEAFSRVVDRAQARGPLLVVAAAGNDSEPDAGDPCATRQRSGLGPFPAELSSPFSWAGLRLGNPNILVAEVVIETGDMRGPLTRASYSNIDGHILAPGDNITGLAGGQADATMAWFSGTSSAAPHVTGAAAYLLNLNPGLDNATLRGLLLAQEGTAVAGTRTTKRLYVPAAIERMRVRMPGGGGRTEPGDRLLADMDDGSRDGFTRLERDDLGAVRGPYRERRIFKERPTRIDMADFRYYRDSAILLEENLSCAADMPACDLNGDGRFDVCDASGEDTTLLALERFPRAQLVPRLGEGETLLRSAEALVPIYRLWDGDPVQGWRAEDLPGLMTSSDYEFYPQAFMSEAGARALRVTLLGAVSPAGAPTRTDPYTDREITGRTVWTAPLHAGVRLRVRIVGGSMDGRELESDLPDLSAGRHAHVILNPCALREGSPAPLTIDQVRSCEDGLPPAAIRVEGGGPPRSRGGPVGGETGGEAGGAPAPDSCEALARGGAPYACFRLTAEGYDSGQVMIVEPPAKDAGLYHGYYNRTYDNWPLKLQGRAAVRGSLEDVYVTLMFWGRESRSEAWNPNQEGNNDFSLHFTTTDFPNSRKLREFQVAYGPGGQNLATRVDAVGGFIEGTFEGQGHLFVNVGEERERRPGAAIRGSFRVRRGPDP